MDCSSMAHSNSPGDDGQLSDNCSLSGLSDSMHSSTESLCSNDSGLSISLHCNALSAIAGSTVLPWDEYEKRIETQEVDYCRGPLSMGQLYAFSRKTFRKPYVKSSGITSLPKVSFSGSSFYVSLRTITGCKETMKVVSTDTIEDLKRKLEMEKGIAVEEQYFMLNGRPLDDQDTVEDCEMYPNCSVEVFLRLKGGSRPIYGLSDTFLDPKFDYDFTYVADDAKFYRGCLEYYRPCGFMRYAIKVLGEYDSDKWLGLPGYRHWDCPDEWPVSYHGTTQVNARDIASGGYDISLSRRQKYGAGIYSSPKISGAIPYATEFAHGGDKYRVVLQNRVNPATLKRFRIKHKDGNGTANIWLSGNESDVRPYGICIQRTN